MFRNPDAVVKLENYFNDPFDNAVATARTCYSSRVISAGEAAAKTDLRDKIAQSIFEAGHHTTIQHAHFQFSISGVSRNALHSFFHSHPFYNSEQVSQRYVAVKNANFIKPEFGEQRLNDLFDAATTQQIEAYRKLTELLTPIAAQEYYAIFPGRLKVKDKYDKEVQKKAQEIARYVLPLATPAHLYHTVSLLTLIRYHVSRFQPGTPSEVSVIVDKMVDLVCRHDWKLRRFFTEEMEQFPEVLEDNPDFLSYFDRDLGDKSSKLKAYDPAAEELLYETVLSVLGKCPKDLSKEDALDLLLNPAKNNYLGQTVNVSSHSPLTRALQNVSYTFKRKMSHAGDSQDQRHRMVPGSRPVLINHLSDKPDYYTPELIKKSEQALKLYQETMEQSWGSINKLANYTTKEFLSYLLPNAVNVRYFESGNLLNLHHKWKARLCYTAQEEIWRSSLEEVMQVSQVHPTIGKYLLPPCGLRNLSGVRPFCPEGSRYCGVPVWKLERKDYSRLI